MVNSNKITGFEQLIAWQKSQDLAVEVYKCTRDFPSDERFALTNQLRRSVNSVSANIAEGFGRRSIKDKLHFYTIGYGSLLETKNFIYLSERLDYISNETVSELVLEIVECQKLLNALMRSLK